MIHRQRAKLLKYCNTRIRKRRSYLSIFFFTIEPHKITKRSKNKVTVVEGNTLFLVCEAQGIQQPQLSGTKKEPTKLIPSSMMPVKRMQEIMNARRQTSQELSVTRWTLPLKMVAHIF